MTTQMQEGFLHGGCMEDSQSVRGSSGISMFRDAFFPTSHKKRIGSLALAYYRDAHVALSLAPSSWIVSMPPTVSHRCIAHAHMHAQ